MDAIREGNPIRMRGLDHVVLRCVDLQAMLDFYRETLGCVFERLLEELGLYQLRAGSSLIDIVPVGSELGGDSPPAREAFNMAHFCLRVENPRWDRIRAHLESRGIAWKEPARRYGADGSGLSIYLEDPEGNVVELKGEPDSPPVSPA